MTELKSDEENEGTTPSKYILVDPMTLAIVREFYAITFKEALGHLERGLKLFIECEVTEDEMAKITDGEDTNDV